MLVVLCDGTWCGQETRTESNIWRLAKAFGIELHHDQNEERKGFEFEDTDRNFKARYFTGCGLGRPFLYYLYDGATGSDIAEDCIGVYQYIVDNYNGQPIWVFGLSRGAFTVRCVAGMINNCGIVDRRKKVAGISENKCDKPDSICQEVYNIYRSPHKDDGPKSIKMTNFKNKFSHSEQFNKPPIKFMGLIDTVGSLGIPRLNPGVTTGGEWPEFHDQEVSSVVEKVYHARSLHDRLWIFQPCRASRDLKHRDNKDLIIHEKWFPGCHYDLGRQKFVFFRTGTGPGVNRLERLVSWILGFITRPVEPNEAIANLVLKWLFDKIRKEAGNDFSFHDEEDVRKVRLADLTFTMDSMNSGSGDVYSKLHLYVPGARLFLVKLLLWILSAVPGLRTVAKLVLATHDRRISCGVLAQGERPSIGESMVKTETFDYKGVASRDAGKSKAVKSWYPSETYEMHQRFCCGQHQRRAVPGDRRSASTGSGPRNKRALPSRRSMG